MGRDEVRKRKVLLTGATGFIGRRVLDRLLRAGHEVRAVSRRPASQLDLPDHERLEIRQGDALREEDLGELLKGIEVAYYLIHSMDGDDDDEEAFIERDKRAALNFSRAAKRAGVEQIIYLSGLKPPRSISKHLQSRNDVERYLAEDGVPVTVLRAGFIIGPESAGFQMLRGIVSNMKAMMISEELKRSTQPAYAGDVIEALALCMERPERVRGETFEIGSREVVSYYDIIQSFCDGAGREVEFLEVPWVPHTLAATYIAASSGLPYVLIKALSAGLNVDLYVKDERLYERFPTLPRTSPEEAMRLAWGEVSGS